jgi:hypothetical protein
VNRALDKWDEKVRRLSAERVGKNRDFPSFEQIVGVVCTPSPVYTRRPPVWVLSGVRIPSRLPRIATT